MERTAYFTRLDWGERKSNYEKNLQITYYLYDHLGNSRVVFHTKQDKCSDDPEYVAEYVADYYPFGKILREWAPCQIERYLTTYHERDKGSGYDNRGARFYDSELGRFLSTDPMAADFAAWSTYNYAFDNPVMYTDPDGMAPQSPIFGEDGKFLGTDSEGFKGDIVIMREKTYNALTNNGAETLDHSLTEKIVGTNSFFAQTLDNYVANDFNIANLDDQNFLSNVFTNLLSAAKDEGLISYDVSNLVLGKIGIDNDTGSPNNDAATMYDAGGGKDAISVLMKPGEDGGNYSMKHVGNAANAIHILGVHEPLHRKHRSRGMKGHHPMYKEIYGNPEYRKTLKNVTPAVRELAESWKKGK